jgi:putative lysine transport system permease protein
VFFLGSKIPADLLGGSWYIYQRYAPLFWAGARTTLLISLSATVIGLIIGLIVASIRNVKFTPKDSLLSRIFKKFMHLIATIYIEVFRGTPMMVQAVFLYHGLRQYIMWSPIQAGIFIVSINTGAYMAEIIRAGIQSIDDGQYEAARSIGMNNTQAMIKIILPQAIRNAFPAIGNEFVVNIKDTSVLNVISVTELFFQSNSVAGIVFRYRDTFLVTAVIYLFLTFTTTQILRAIERKLDSPKGFGGASQSMPGNFPSLKRKEQKA